jgi:hypothetical protein
MSTESFLVARALRARILLVVCIALLTPTSFATFAFGQWEPGYTFDLRVHGTGAKEVTVQEPGDTITLDVFVHVRGNDADPSNDGLNNVLGGFRSIPGGLLGDLAGVPPPAPFNQTSSSPGQAHDLDADGDLDVGSTVFVNGPPPSDWYFARGGGDTHYGESFLVGQVRFTAFSLAAASTDVNWYGPPPGEGAQSHIVLLGQMDGLTQTVYMSDDPRLHFADPVTIRADHVIGGGNTTYLSGTIDEHVVVTETVRPAPGTTLILNRGITVNAGGLFDSRDATGDYGPHEIRINDTTSSNDGGAIFVANLKLGTSAPGVFSQNRGLVKLSNDLTVGAGAPGSFLVSGGTALAKRLVVGGSSDGQVVHSGGQVTVGSLLLGQTGGVASSYALSGAIDSSVLSASVGTIGGASNTVFHQTGGQSNFNTTLTISGNGATHGSIDISGGLLSAARANLVAGGQVDQTGGTFSAGNFNVGRPNAGADLPSQYSLHDGALVVGSGFVGDHARGTLAQTGGSAQFAGGPYVHDLYDLSGGTVRGYNMNIYAPEAGSAGLMQQSGGYLVTDWLDVYGTYRITGGSFTVNRQLTIHPGGTIDFGSGNAALVASTNSMLNVPSTGFGNSANASLIGQVDSLINYPQGFVLADHFGHVSTQGLLHEDFTPLHIPAGRRVGGVGTIHGNVTNDGGLIPGYSGGVMDIDGTYTQSGAADMLVEIGGTDQTLYDALHVTGNVTLDGLLNVHLIGGFVPAADDVFAIVTGSSLTGHFANAQGSITFDGGRFDVFYTGNSVLLSNFQTVPEPTMTMAMVLGAVGVLSQRRHRRASHQ